MQAAGVLFLGVVTLTAGAAVASESCPQPGSEIATDRPDVTNSSLVVPKGSFQQENGASAVRRLIWIMAMFLFWVRQA